MREANNLHLTRCYHFRARQNVTRSYLALLTSSSFTLTPTLSLKGRGSKVSSPLRGEVG